MKIIKVTIVILVTVTIFPGCAIWQSEKWSSSFIKVKNKIHRFLFFKEVIPSEEDFNKFISDNNNHRLYNEFVSYLEHHQLSHVVPPKQLLRQGTEWDYLDLPPFVIPPKKDWKNILPVLVLIRDELKPVLKDIEVVSGYRNKEYNQKAGGAKKSRHLFFDAVDLIPRSEITKEELDTLLLSIWNKRGKRYNMGLGLYLKMRFHVDTFKYRIW